MVIINIYFAIKLVISLNDQFNLSLSWSQLEWLSFRGNKSLIHYKTLVSTFPLSCFNTEMNTYLRLIHYKNLKLSNFHLLPFNTLLGTESLQKLFSLFQSIMSRFFPGSSIASSKANSRCCVWKHVHLWAPCRNLREPKVNSREPWVLGTP